MSNKEHLLHGSVSKRRVRFNEVVMNRLRRGDSTTSSTDYEEYDE